MIFTVLKFFTGGSLLGKISSYALIALFSSGILYGAYNIHINAVEARALAEYNQKQLQQYAADQQKLINQLQHVSEVTDQVVIDLKAKSEEAEVLKNSVTEFLASKEAVNADRDASLVLKETIRRLSGVKK